MPRRYSPKARTFLREMVFYTGLGMFAWLYPKTYAKVFLQIEVVILTVPVFVVLMLLRISRGQRRAKRVREGKSPVVIPIRD